MIRHFRLLSSVAGLSGSMQSSASRGPLMPRVARSLRLEPALLGAVGPTVDVAAVTVAAEHDQDVASATVELPGAVGCADAGNGALPRPRRKFDVVAPVGKLPLSICSASLQAMTRGLGPANPALALWACPVVLLRSGEPNFSVTPRARVCLCSADDLARPRADSRASSRGSQPSSTGTSARACSGLFDICQPKARPSRGARSM